MVILRPSLLMPIAYSFDFLSYVEHCDPDIISVEAGWLFCGVIPVT